MVSQRLAKPSYLLDSLSSILSVGAIYTSSVTVARLAPTQLVRVQILGGVPLHNIGESHSGNCWGL